MMIGISTVADPKTLSLTVTAEFAASPERVWGVWENPRLLERWWGPPSYPATFTRHDFAVGGESRYYMTGPAGDKSRGWWRMFTIDEPRSLEFANGLAGEDGEPQPGVDPMAASVTIDSFDGGTRMTVRSKFVDMAQMEKMIDMGMSEGMTQAIRQIDDVLTSQKS
jgi:uncharacterized protein YndB with AHSA1/START domain